MKNKNATLNVALQSITLIVIIIFSVWLSMGFKFNLDAINKEFFVRVGVNLAVSLMCYNTIFGMYFGNLARNEKCRYFITVATKKLRIEKIYKDNRHEDLKKAIDGQNEKDLEEVKDIKVRNVCERISYEDIKALKGDALNGKLKEYKAFYALSKFTVWRLGRIIKRILSGKIKIDKLKPRDILTDTESHKLKQNSLKTYAVKRTIRRNIKKTIKGALQAGVWAVLAFSPTGVNFWQTLVNQLSLFLMAAVSGLIAASRESKYITDIYDSHNKFILQNLNIADEYTPTEN